MNPYRDNNYYPVDYNNNGRQVKVKDNSNDLKYFLIAISIIILVIIICFINIIIPDNKDENNDKKYNNNELENITQTIIDTEEGYKEETVFYTSVKEKKIVSSSVGSRRYLISYKEDSLNDYEFVEIGVQLYNDLEIGDKIKVIKTIYYNDKDKKLYSDNYIEKIKMF